MEWLPGCDISRTRKFFPDHHAMPEYTESSGGRLLIGRSGDGQFDLPGNVAVDGSRNVYVMDMTNERVQKFK